MQVGNSGLIRKLSNEQVEAFDREYVDADRLRRVCSRIEADFPDGEFSFLDVGGGNGRFADQLLERFPLARGTVLDNSETLLARNKPDPRKTRVLGSADDLSGIRGPFDLISMHWLLHHLVGDTYRATRLNQRNALASLARLLSHRGRVSVFENDYVGWLPDPYPTWAIYMFTSSRALTPVARALGANTAGTGVCFNSESGWRRTIDAAGLDLIDRAEPDSWRRRIQLHARAALGLRDVRVGHYWLRART
jgi:SAM-dependent methyltransferase